MATSAELVQETIGVCRDVAAAAPPEERARLEKMATGLDGLLGKVFIKTKVAVPFATTMAEAAQALQTASQSLAEAPADEEAHEEFVYRVDALQNEVDTLISKGTGRDIVIT
jgi:hypothetical protein